MKRTGTNSVSRSPPSTRSKGFVTSDIDRKNVGYSDGNSQMFENTNRGGVGAFAGEEDALEILQKRLNHVRWKRMQNRNKMKSILVQTKQMQELDVVSDLSSNRIDEKIGWMKNVIEDELRQPLIIPDKPPDLFDLEKKQRREILRFDKHIRVVELMADKLRVNDPLAVDLTFAKTKQELLKDCGMEVLRKSGTSSGLDSFNIAEDETNLSDYLALVSTIGQEIEDGGHSTREDMVPAVTRLALLHRELTEQKQRHLRATNELIRYQKSDFNIRR